MSDSDGDGLTLPWEDQSPLRGPEVACVPGYEIEGELGRGGMGVVYRARHLALERDVALKMVLTGAHASAQERARFRDEAQAIARLSHPNIVQIHEVGEHGGLPYLALELCAGGSLEGKLKGAPLAPAEAARLVATLAGAVQAAHDKGVVHRDLKPGNVLLAADGTPKVTDFGLAKDLGSGPRTASGTVVGTPAYMAPEQAAGRKDVGPAADIYALAAILYECLTGRPPFKGPSPMETLFQVLHDEPPPPRVLQPGVPRDLETVCLKGLRKEPAERYGSALALAADLERFLRGEPVTARPVGWPTRLAKWARRRPAVAGLLALAVVLCVTGTTISTRFWLLAAERADQAEKSAALAKEQRDRAENALALGLLRPLGHDDRPLTPAEVGALWDLLLSDGDRLRLLFLERALERPEVAARVARRGEWVAHAVAGLDTSRRERVLALVRDRLGDEQAPASVREACVVLATALGADDERFRAAASRIALDAITQTADPLAAARRAIGLGDRLGPAQAAAVVGRLLDAMDRTTEPNALRQCSAAAQALAGRLAPDAASAMLGRALDLMARAPDFNSAFVASEVAGALAPRLAPEAVPPAVRRALELMKRAEDAAILGLLGQLLARLPGPRDPAECSAVVGRLLDRMGQTADVMALQNLGNAIYPLAERLGRAEASAASERALGVVLKATHPETFSRAAGALDWFARRARPQDTARAYAAAAARGLELAAQSAAPETTAAYAEAVTRLADQLTALEKSSVAGKLLTALRAPDGTISPVGASGLARHLRALAALADQLGPQDAARVRRVAAEKVADRLDGVANLVAVARLLEGVMAALERLKPEDAAPLYATAARKAGAAATQGSDSLGLQQLASPLTRLAKHLGPKEAAAVGGAYAAHVLDLLGKATNAGDRHNLTSAVADLAELLGPDDATAAARTLLGALSTNGDPFAQARSAWALSSLGERLGAADATAAARTLLGALRTTNNPDAVASLAGAITRLTGRLAPQEAAAVRRQLLDFVMKTDSPTALARLKLEVGALTERLGPDEAAALADRYLDALRKPGSQVPFMRAIETQDQAQAVAALAPRLLPAKAALAAATVLDVMNATDDPIAQRPLASAAAALAARCETQAVVDLLKRPTCVRGASNALLADLGRRAGRTFADVWAFVDWAREHEPGLDLTTAPPRPAE